MKRFYLPLNEIRMKHAYTEIRKMASLYQIGIEMYRFPTQR